MECVQNISIYFLQRNKRSNLNVENVLRVYKEVNKTDGYRILAGIDTTKLCENCAIQLEKDQEYFFKPQDLFSKTYHRKILDPAGAFRSSCF